MSKFIRKIPYPRKEGWGIFVDESAFVMGTILPSTSGAMISSAVGVVGSLIAQHFTEIRNNDVSASGSYITIQTKDIDTGSADGPIPEPFVITHFADDKPPFTLAPFKVNETSTSYRGDVLAWKTITIFDISLSVIPNSEDDLVLSALAGDEQFEAGPFGCAYGMSDIEITLSIPRVKSSKKTRDEEINIKFFNGRLVESPGASSSLGSSSNASTEGRLEGKTYKFRFTWCRVHKTKVKKQSWGSSIAQSLIGV